MVVPVSLSFVRAPAHLGVTENRAINGMCTCVYNTLRMRMFNVQSKTDRKSV